MKIGQEQFKRKKFKATKNWKYFSQQINFRTIPIALKTNL